MPGTLLPRCQAHFNCTNQLGHIVFVNSLGGRRIKPLEYAMQMARTLFCGALAQALTQSFRTLRPGEEPFQQRAEI